MSTVDRPNFIRRFDEIWARKRLNHLSQAFFLALLALLAGFSLLCAADYVLEIQWNARAWSLALLIAACVVFGGYQAVAAVRRWNRGSTAAKIEENFPQLGQTVRTAVQFGAGPDAIRSTGVATTLVDALEDQADEQTRPLQLDSIIPRARLWLAAIAVLSSVVVLGIAAGRDWEWRTATSRALLGDQAYTTLEVQPGDCSVLEGHDQAIEFTIHGRMREEVAIYTREQDQPEWTALEVTEDDRVDHEPQLNRYNVVLTSIGTPLDYKVRVGELISPEYRVGVHYPLEITDISAVIAAPAYTALPEKTVQGGNLNAIAGSTIDLEITLDRVPETAHLSLRDLGTSKDELERASEEIPLEINDNVLTARLSLHDHKVYSIVARATDGMEVPENNYRIRVRQDQQPKVWFESPDEALEVHTLAEVLMRIRTTDDFGLSRAGVSFEINNEETFDLISEDFQTLADALDSDEPIDLVTRQTLEKILPLEAITLSQKDSVTYYAFAEDNYPDGPHRVESELRFVDIRPFRRLYRVIEPMPGMPGQQRDLANLDELIARERFALNRTVRLNRRVESKEEIDLNTIDRLISFQTEIADYTQRLAKFLEEIGIDGSDLLFQAEESMLATVDSLSVGKYDTAQLQEKDALRYLIEGRDKINIAIRNNTNRTVAQRLRRFDRTQTQKLRRPKSEQEQAEDIARRIEQLASRQEFVYETLTGIKMDADNPNRQQQSQASGSGGKNNRPRPKTQQGQSGNGSSGKQGSSGQSSSSGEQDPAEAESNNENASGDSKNQPENEGDRESEGKGDSESEGDSSDSPGARDEEQDGQRESDEGDGGAVDELLTREELEELQEQIAMDAEALASELQDMTDATELIRERMQAIAEATDQVGASLGEGDDERAEQAAGAAAGELREAAQNARGVLDPDATQRVALARDIAGRIGRQQRRLARQIDESDKESTESSGGGGGGPTEQDARELAESGRTLQDILESIEKGFDPADQAAVSQVESLLNEGKVQEAVSRMQQIAQMVEARDSMTAKISAGDVADQMDVTAQRLDMIHRNVVAPRVEQIRRMQELAQRLSQQLETRETSRQIGSWHAQAEELLEQLEEQGLAANSREDLQQAMQAGGYTQGDYNRRWSWALDGEGYYSAPAAYTSSAQRIVKELQRHIQELVLGDLLSSDDGAVPPEYEGLVDRYLEVLSSESQ